MLIKKPTDIAPSEITPPEIYAQRRAFLRAAEGEPSRSRLRDAWRTLEQELVRYRVDQIVKALDRLPDNYRIILSLYLLEGYDHQEISEILGISESASRTNLFRGKQKLQQRLKHLRYGTGY